MTVLSQALGNEKRPRRNSRRTFIVCTHAKFSALELCRALRLHDIEVVFYPVDYSREPEVVDEMLAEGIEIIEQPDKLLPYILTADAVIEDGARVSKLIKQHGLRVKPGFYSVEQTSGGVRFFEEQPPRYPVINVAKSPVKLHIENQSATPEGVLHYFAASTGMLLSGKNVLVIGYGNIGEGIARLARIAGAKVSIYDVFATRRLFAKHRGLDVIEREKFDHCLSRQDVIFMATNTYQGSLIGPEQILLMRDGAIVCNAGSGRGELALSLQQPGTRVVHEATLTTSIDDGHLVYAAEKFGNEKTVKVLGESFPINLHLGVGTSHDAIEVVMALLALAALRGPVHRRSGLQPLSHDIQELVAEICLQTEPADALTPRLVKTKSLPVINKPYGGLAPFHNELGSKANLSVARAWFIPGSKTRGHNHRGTQESYYVEAGSADIVLWHRDTPDLAKSYAVEAGDYLLVPEGYFHDVRVTSDSNFECLVIATPPFDVWDQFFKTEEA